MTKILFESKKYKIKADGEGGCRSLLLYLSAGKYKWKNFVGGVSLVSPHRDTFAYCV